MSELQTYVVQASPGVVARFCRICEQGGLFFRAMPVHSGSTSAEGLGEAEGTGVTPLLLRQGRAAEVLDVSLSTINRLIKEGHLPAVHVNGTTRVRVADLQRFVERLAQDDQTSVDDPMAADVDRGVAPPGRGLVGPGGSLATDLSGTAA